jgi:hypothetical protein
VRRISRARGWSHRTLNVSCARCFLQPAPDPAPALRGKCSDPSLSHLNIPRGSPKRPHPQALSAAHPAPSFLGGPIASLSLRGQRASASAAVLRQARRRQHLQRRLAQQEAAQEVALAQQDLQQQSEEQEEEEEAVEAAGLVGLGLDLGLGFEVSIGFGANCPMFFRAREKPELPPQ